MNKLTDYGFTWGPMEVTRVCVLGRKGYILQIKTDNKSLAVYVSEKGRSVRVFLDGKALEARR